MSDWQNNQLNQKNQNSKSWFLEIGFSIDKYDELKNEFGTDFEFLLISFATLLDKIVGEEKLIPLRSDTDLDKMMEEIFKDKLNLIDGNTLKTSTKDISRALRLLLEDWIVIKVSNIESKIAELDSVTIKELYYQTKSSIPAEIIENLSQDDQSVLIYALALSEEFILDDPRFDMPSSEFNEAVDFYIRQGIKLYRELHDIPENINLNFKVIKVAFASRWDLDNLIDIDSILPPSPYGNI